MARLRQPRRGPSHLYPRPRLSGPSIHSSSGNRVMHSRRPHHCHASVGWRQISPCTRLPRSCWYLARRTVTLVARYYRDTLVFSRDPIFQGSPNREGLGSRAGRCLRASTTTSRAQEAPAHQRGLRTEQSPRAARKPTGEVGRRQSRAALNPHQQPIPNLLRLDRWWRR